MVAENRNLTVHYFELQANLRRVITAAGGDHNNIMRSIERELMTALEFLQMIAPNGIRFTFDPHIRNNTKFGYEETLPQALIYPEMFNG